GNATLLSKDSQQSLDVSLALQRQGSTHVPLHPHRVHRRRAEDDNEAGACLHLAPELLVERAPSLVALIIPNVQSSAPQPCHILPTIGVVGVAVADNDMWRRRGRGHRASLLIPQHAALQRYAARLP